MELIYLYIGDIGRQIKNQGFNFSNKYDVSYEAETKELIIKKKQNPIPKIYGDHIVNITALVGQNGVGKSTVLNLLGLKDKDIRQEFGAFVRSDLSWFAIYEVQHDEGNKRIFLFEGYNRKYIPENIEVENDSEYYTFYIKRNFCNEQDETCLKTAEIHKDYCSHIRYFYYGQSAQTTQGEENLKSSSKGLRDMERKYLSRCGSFRERINLCYALLNQTEDDGMKVLGEIFHTTSPEHLTLTIRLPYWGTAPYVGKEGENYRTIEKESNKLNEILYLPDPNKSLNLFNTIDIYADKTEAFYQFCILLLKTLLCKCLNSLGYLDSEKDLQTLQGFVKSKNFQKKIESDMTKADNVEYLLNFIMLFNKLTLSNDKNVKKTEEYPCIEKISDKMSNYKLERVIVLCVLLTGDDRYTHYIENWLGKRYDSSIVQLEGKANRKAFALDKDQIEANGTYVKFTITGISEETKEVLLAIAAQLDILYNSRFGQDYHAIIETSFSDISTGELRFIDFFADLYEIFNKDIGTSTVKDDIDNQTMILLFDEPDSCLHPEWARQFIYALNSILNVKPFAEKSINYQIILTTHSPIMLSDIPSEHIVCMARDKNDLNKINVRKADFGFASNIYDIMKSSFFMEKYFGEFASRFVEELADECAKLKTAILKDELYAESKVYADKKRGLIDKIVLIGEPRLKRYYMNQIEQIDELVFQNNKSKMDYKHLRSHLRSIYGDEELQKIAKILLDSGEDV